MIKLYSKDNCGYCMMAKGFLNNNGFEYEIVAIDKDDEARDFIMNEGHRTMPQIYVNGKVIDGGWNGLNALGVDGLNALINETTLNTSELGSL